MTSGGLIFSVISTEVEYERTFVAAWVHCKVLVNPWTACYLLLNLRVRVLAA
jgi:hypothetical protein